MRKETFLLGSAKLLNPGKHWSEVTHIYWISELRKVQNVIQIVVDFFPGSSAKGLNHPSRALLMVVQSHSWLSGSPVNLKTFQVKNSNFLAIVLSFAQVINDKLGI